MRVAVLVLLFLFLLAGDARACSCVGAASGFPNARGAFVGEIVARTDGPGGRVAYTFAVEKVYKGSFPQRVTLPSNAAEASCGMDHPVGFRTGIVMFRDALEVGICSLISEDELDDLATPVPPAGPPPGAAEASLVGRLLGFCWSVWR